jgi:hypothetical protein
MSALATAAVLAVALVVSTLAFSSSSGIAAPSSNVTAFTAAAPSGHMRMATLPANRKEAALYLAMRKLWGQHMEWTYATVAAFVEDSPGLNATLTRLLRNQTDIGNAIEPFYGKKAGKKLTALLMTHINDAVPVLVAARNGDTAAFNKAEKAWYANAKQIADFLAAANPHWHKSAMERMMKTHITQTTTYAADQLQGHYAKSIHDYNKAEAHMRDMADMLSAGIVKQFPRRF